MVLHAPFPFHLAATMSATEFQFLNWHRLILLVYFLNVECVWVFTGHLRANGARESTINFALYLGEYQKTITHWCGTNHFTVPLTVY